MENKTNNPKIEDEKTLIERIPEEKTIVDAVELDANGKPVKQKRTISKKTALLAGGGALLAGVGAYALSSHTDASQAAPAGGDSSHWDPHTAPEASSGTVNDNMTFAEAFTAARHETGVGGVFTWHGQTYSAFYEGEVNQHYQPTVDTPTVAHHDISSDHDTHTTDVAQNDNGDHLVTTGQHDASVHTDVSHTSNEAHSDWGEPDIIGIDSDNDGKVDMVFVDINHDGSADAVYADVNHDGQITPDEVQIIHDPNSLHDAAHHSDGSVMTVDVNFDGKDDVVVTDADHDHIAESVSQIDATNTNDEHHSSDHIVYDGEISTEVPHDVPTSELDHHSGDLASMNDHFDSHSWNA